MSDALPAPLVRPAELAPILGRIRLLDARSQPGPEHLLGAVRADLEQDLSGPSTDPAVGGRHPLPSLEDWAHTLGRWGIGPGTPVVIYDDKGGTNAACRAWWMLRAVGHGPVAVLDGGFQAAVAQGLPRTTEPAEVQALPPYPVTDWKSATVDMEEVDRLRTDPDWRLVDVRAGERYRGETEPLDPIAGHIPGALNLPCAENLGPDGRFKSAEALRASLAPAIEGVSGDHIVVHCGSGVTACHTLLALELAGVQGPRLYVGSWSEWCRNERPRA